MSTVLILVELFVSIGLIVVILLQRSEGGALGMGGGGGGLGGLFSPRGAADTLTRTTSILGIAFFVVCLALNIVVRQGGGGRTSIMDQSAPGHTTTAPQKAPANKTPAVPPG